MGTELITSGDFMATEVCRRKRCAPDPAHRATAAATAAPDDPRTRRAWSHWGDPGGQVPDPSLLFRMHRILQRILAPARILVRRICVCGPIEKDDQSVELREPPSVISQQPRSETRPGQTAVGGRFWAVDTPHRARVGTLSYGAGERATLRVDLPIVDQLGVRIEHSENGETTITETSNPEHTVADFAPRTIHGEINDHEPVTLLDAHGGHEMFLNWGFGQEFVARFLLIGSHVSGPAQEYKSIRFRFDDWHWWRHFAGTAEPVLTTSGTLRCYELRDAAWFEFTANTPRTLQEFDTAVQFPVQTIARLALDERVEVTETELRETPESAWLPVISARSSRPIEIKRSTDRLLPRQVLTLERFARWIDVSARLDGLAAPIADPMEGVAVQASTLTYVAIAEGLHRRLYTKTKRFPGITNSQFKAIRSTAASAGLLEFEAVGCVDMEEAKHALDQALGFLNDVTYRNRLAELIMDARRAVPEIVGSFSDWEQLVKTVRNNLAHQPVSREPMSEKELDEMIAVNYSVPWVLRIVLLQQAGIDDELIGARVNDNIEFQYYLANTRAILSRADAAGPQKKPSK